MKDNIIIRKQKFSIKTSNEQLALELRRRVNDDLQYSLSGVYDEIFSSLNVTPGNNIYIDKITLSLGRITNEVFAEQLPQLVKQALLKQLQNEPSVKESVQHQMNNTVDNSTTHSAEHDDVAALMYFFENGMYPWWFNNISAIKPSEIIKSFTNASAENLLVQIISKQRTNNAINSERIIQRFLQHLSPDDYQKIVTALIALQSNQQLKTNLQLLENNDTVLLLSVFFLITGDIYRKELIAFMLKQWYSEDQNILKGFITQLFRKFKTSDSFNINTGNTFTSSQKLNKEIKETINTILKESGISQQVNESNKDSNLTKDISATGIIEGIYINNSGLVLLHPFLLPLFEVLGLLQTDHSFVSQQAAFKAAVVLYYLQSSSVVYEEHEMAFNKILCGINIEELLPNNIVLTIEEKKECDELLYSVISYWDALKGASIAAVQETFIQHKGKIGFKEDHWLLQVERIAADILTDRLPWSFSTIKLPWLKHIIYTEW
ncbi:MAG: contractile injection system tape measure protein [Panacibacter sp.]